MKYTLFIILFVCELTSAYAVPNYVRFKSTFWGGWRLIHLDTPPKKIHKWSYDRKTDTYYLMTGIAGLRVPLKVVADDERTQTGPDYILFKQSFFGVYKLTHLDQPPKKLKKWRCDKNNKCYRIASWVGIGGSIKNLTPNNLPK